MVASMSSTNLVALLLERAAADPERVAHTFLRYPAAAPVEERLTLGELLTRAQGLAAGLEGRGVAGRPVALAYGPGLEFPVAFWGCLLAGAIPIPVQVGVVAREGALRATLGAVVGQSGARLVLADAELIAMAAGAELPVDVLPGAAVAGDPSAWSGPAPPGELAYLQYSSGSTSRPRGVRLGHANVIAQSRGFAERSGMHAESVMVCWQPHFHDLGLVFGYLLPLVVGIPSVVFSALDFVKRPARWLEAVSRYRGTHSAAPNFAYDLCVDRVTPAERRELDLSSWELAGNGAEPVLRRTLERFVEAFAPSGFRATTLRPGYGMAETTLLVCFTPPRGEFRCARIDEKRERGGAALAKGREVVSCGVPLPGLDVAITDPQSGARLPDGQIGEVRVAGSSVALGYWEQPTAEEEAFRTTIPGLEGTYLRTGDLGFLEDGELYVTGRLKDLIVVAGRNLDPADLERTAARVHSALAPHRCAALGVGADEQERVVLLVEASRELAQGPWPDLGRELLAGVRRAVTAEHGVEVQRLLVVGKPGLPRTTSGKLQRWRCHALLAGGALFDSARL